MKPRLIPLMLACVLAISARAEENKYTVDKDVRALCEVKLFAFDIVAISGISGGERYLSRILKKDDSPNYLAAVYNRGSPEAKLYALAAFHYLAPKVYELCEKDIIGKYNPIVQHMEGCIAGEGTMLEFVIRIHKGQYDGYIKKYTER